MNFQTDTMISYLSIFEILSKYYKFLNKKHRTTHNLHLFEGKNKPLAKRRLHGLHYDKELLHYKFSPSLGKNDATF